MSGDGAPLSYDAFIGALRSYIAESKKIIEQLKSVKSFVNRSHKGVNITKTIGTTGGVTAVIAFGGLLFAPLTGGLSAIASAVAIGGTIVSAGIGAFTLFVESSDGKKAKKLIESSQADHEASVDRLNVQTNRIMDVVNQLVERGINFEVATISTITFLGELARSGTIINNAVSTVAKIENAIKVGQIQKILAPTGISITKTLQGGMRVAFPSAQVVEKLTEAQIQAFGALHRGPEILLGKTISTFGKVTIIVSVIFTVADIALLINSWSTPHPLVAPIDNFISQLEASIESSENQLKCLDLFRR